MLAKRRPVAEARRLMKLIFLGDVVGEPGREVVAAAIPALREQYGADFFVVNGENAAGGRGITPKLAIDLMRYGADVITLGDHTWDQREIQDFFPTEPRLLRPLNFPDTCPGAGTVVVEGNGKKLAVANLLGNTFMGPVATNPFLIVDDVLDKLREETPCILLDFHCEATSEKVAMGRAADGKASVVVGTHTHVQTADERILPGGTAYLTDAGFCGGQDSVIGRNVESVLEKYRTQIQGRWHIAKGWPQANGLFVEIDEDNGKAVSLERIQWQPTEPAS